MSKEDDSGITVEQKGWLCPKCKCVISPLKSTCPICTPKTNEGTSNSGSAQLLTEQV